MTKVITLLCLIACLAYGQKKNDTQSLRVADSLFLAGKYDNAIPIYEAVVKKASPKATAQTWYRLGFANHQLKRYARAISAYSEVEKLNSRFQGLHVNFSRALSANGEVDKAVGQLDSALAIGFGNHKLLEQDPEFDRMRQSSGFAARRDRAYANSHPCVELAAARAFDFWLGEWDVFVTSNMNVKAGVNRITMQSGTCVLLESWESQGAHAGVSINYYDPTNGKWQQKWAGSGQDILEFYDGEYVDGAMRFKWEGTNPDGTRYPGKLTFTNFADGRVRQHSQRSTDGGKTWVDVYDFTYVRQK